MGPNCLGTLFLLAGNGPRYLAQNQRAIRECQRTPFTGTGKLEALKGNLRGYWSRRINHEHRLVYQVAGETLFVAACRFHYEK